jgi:hypothetical protein
MSLYLRRSDALLIRVLAECKNPELGDDQPTWKAEYKSKPDRRSEEATLMIRSPVRHFGCMVAAFACLLSYVSRSW